MIHENRLISGKENGRSTCDNGNDYVMSKWSSKQLMSMSMSIKNF